MVTQLAGMMIAFLIGFTIGVYSFKLILRKLHKAAIRIRKIQRGGR